MSPVLWKTGHAVYWWIGTARPRRDTPFIEAHTQGIYDDLRSSLSSMLHTSLKTSDDLQYAMLTGIQRIVKEKEYAEYFGFKKAEVEQILHAYDYEYNTEIQNM